MGLPQNKPGLIGILFIALGIVWLLNNLEIFRVDVGKLVVTYWPVLLMFWGAGSLRQGLWPGGGTEKGERADFEKLLSGFVLLCAGVLVLGRNLGMYQLDLSVFWKVFWPAVLVLIGWSFLRETKGSGGFHWAVMSGINLKNKGWKAADGNFLAFMGGVEMDLTVADIPEQEIVLNLVAVMGGIDVRVPAGIEVECTGTAILGGVKFLQGEAGGVIATRKVLYLGEPGSKKRVVIKGLAVMGGIEVKH